MVTPFDEYRYFKNDSVHSVLSVSVCAASDCHSFRVKQEERLQTQVLLLIFLSLLS